MNGLVCKCCGGNRFKKKEQGYECDYCQTLYEFDKFSPKSKQFLDKKKKSKVLLLFLGVFIVILISSLLLANLPSKIALPKTIKPSISQNSSGFKKENYSASQLNNPERNVRIAELSLNQKEIDLAGASVKEYGGEKSADLEKRVLAAQKDHDHYVKKRRKEAPKKDMLVENPNSEFAMTMYYREGGFFSAYGPNFDQYTSQDILRIWGQPDKIITDTEEISKNLTIVSENNEQSESYELKKIGEEWTSGRLTWREVRALLMIAHDNSYGGFSKQFVYEKQGKPNVYFDGEKVAYVTPIVRYVSFNRLPEKYPHAGLGKYPDDFPNNYGLDGRYHEK